MMTNEDKEAGQLNLGIKQVHELMKKLPHYPFDLQSGWLPHRGSPSMRKFFDEILSADREDYAESVRELDHLIESSPVIKHMIERACKQNENLIAYADANKEEVHIPRIEDKETLLNAFNTILKHPPRFIDDDLVGLPFSAFVVGIDPTLDGVMLFSLPSLNEKMSGILQEWNKFLDTEASNVGFRKDGKQWLSEKAKEQYDFPIWKKDSETLPYWKSWNSFFTRQFEDKDKSRPIADPDSNKTVICPNDGSLFRWRKDISKKEVFWFKDMEYSLSDILSSPIKEQQEIIDRHGLVDIFEGGYIFQTYLNPYNFHRWWVPVNGEVWFDPIVIPGYFFNKLVIPDFGGATTASLPYLAQVNARGLVVFQTGDYGYVCCIPLGMSEVSTVTFDDKMRKGNPVHKGQEMGTFNYGGSSFVIIYQKLPGKELIFMNDKGDQYDQDPPLPSGSAGTGGEATWIGSQIGLWVDL